MPFLNNMMSDEGAVRYANAMRAEINSLSVYANYFIKCCSGFYNTSWLMFDPPVVVLPSVLASPV